MIAIEFGTFADGRGFSMARMLRRGGYKSEIRAVGDVAMDRIDFMQRVGLNAFELRDDPHHIERFYRECYSSGFTQRPDLTMMGAFSGLEMACWDIIGKAAGKPVYELIGGKVHDKLRSYTYLYPTNSKGEYDYECPDLAVECALENMERGFTALKFDPAGPYSAYSGHQISLAALERSENFCRKIRDAVGTNCDLLFGTHGQMTPASAIRLAQRIEPYDPL